MSLLQVNNFIISGASFPQGTVVQRPRIIHTILLPQPLGPAYSLHVEFWNTHLYP